MPDILLIQPPIHDFYLTAKRTMPYGLASVAATLRREGFSVEIFDALATSKARILPWPSEMHHLTPYYGRPDRSPFGLFHHFRHFGYSIEHIVRQAKASGAFLIGISALFSAYSETALATAAAIKTVLPRVSIVMGGHHATALPEAVMQHAAVDYVLRGDGEVGLPLLARALRRCGPLDEVPGLVRRLPDGSLSVGEPAYVRDLNTLPVPAFDLIRWAHYQRRGRGSVALSATRGCPFGCSYCAVNAASGQGFRYRSVDAVMAELSAAYAQFPFGFVDFEDEHLGADAAWFNSLLTAIGRRWGHPDLELRAMNGLYAPSLDDATLASMRAAGFRALNLALISTDPFQLKRFSRPDIRSHFDRVLVAAHRSGLSAVGYLIVAGPEQDPAQSVDDLLYLAARRILAGVSVFYPAPGSSDFYWCQRQGYLPAEVGLLRATALPLAHRTDRTQAVTLLRLGRILNFIKALLDNGDSLPDPAVLTQERFNRCGTHDRGNVLLAAFLKDGTIYGVDQDGMLYRHCIDTDLTGRFLDGLARITLQGAG
jgi:anaerobic magnesium-protoporphyrin IX monomethyl ester cyclase